MDRSDPVLAGPPILLPPHPAEPAAAGIPALATVAPVVGALVLWLVTGSAISLAFAALGPLVAVASVLDARRQARRIRRRGAAERAERLDATRTEIVERHSAERAASWRRRPSARGLVDGSGAALWREDAPGVVVVGRGPVASVLRVDGTPVDVVDRELVEFAARLEEAPVLAPAGSGIGIVGPRPLALAVARAVLVQLAHACRPGSVGLAVPDGAAWSWARNLPHHGSAGERVIRVVDAAGLRAGPGRETAGSTGRWPDAATSHALVVVADATAALPPGLATIVRVDGHATATVDRAGAGGAQTTVAPGLLGAAEAAAWAERLRAVAAREGFGGDGLPSEVDLDDLGQPAEPPGSRASLRVRVGRGHGRDIELDLVTGGPHAIVAGTTGSGKSEFLLAWLAALATSHPPERVAFLLVDFKGGAAFEPLRGLPHVAGIVTDLDEAQAERAVLSLRAELRHRESVLRVERARDLVELGPDVDLPRLVIVVDEFQSMVERFPDLGPVIADIAARGRSLGVHLVLASQRPNGVVREQVIANCSIRVSLRVIQRADSVAVVGTEAAASIRPDTPGRGVVDVGDGAPVLFQSARVDARSLAHLRDAHADRAPSRRPWMDPLPPQLPPRELDRAEASASLAPGSLALGLVDVPERQRYDVVAWSPGADGNLLVLGAPGSGRSTALAAVARAAARRHPPLPVVRLDGPRSRRWDTLHAVLERVRRAEGEEMLFLVDDLDTGFRDWPDEHRQAALAAVEAILRDGRRAGVVVAAAAGSPHRLGAGIRESFGRQLLLRHATRADLVHAGGAGDLWRAQDPPGAGQWGGHRVQVVGVPATGSAPPPAPPRVEVGRGGPCAVVSASPRADASELREAGFETFLLEPVGDATVRAALARPPGGSGRVVIGDADAWAANWSLAAIVREEATLVVHGGAREHRVFGAGRTPPLLDDDAAQCLVTAPGRAPRRSAWPPRVGATETVTGTAGTTLNPNGMSSEINDSDMIA
ncbi:FtsK/SpoIIIE domain-containing protein [Agromyces bauzanensis]